MSELDDALDLEIHELETVLLRLTTVRLLMAAGKHRLVDRAAEELEGAMAAYESAERVTRDRLTASGLRSLGEAAERHPETAPGLEQRAAALRAVARDVQVALSTTAATAERSLRAVRSSVPHAPLPSVAASRHPFMVER